MAAPVRASGANLPPNGVSVGLPARIFLYTTDQVASMLSITEETLKRTYLYYEGRSTGRRSLDLLVAVNIAPPEEKPTWRIAERELIRWLRKKRFRYHEWGSFTS